jgi:hypothetical protein
MMNEYASSDLVAAVLALQDATATGFSALEARLSVKIENVETALSTKIDSKIDGLRHEMNRRFDTVDHRFDQLERRVGALERHEDRPTR